MFRLSSLHLREGVNTRVQGYNRNSPRVGRLLPCQCIPCHLCSHSFLKYVDGILVGTSTTAGDLHLSTAGRVTLHCTTNSMCEEG